MLVYKDTIKLAQTSTNGYGDKSISDLTEVRCLFLQSSGSSHAGNVDTINTDAHAYLDITNPIVKNNGFRLEGMYIQAAPFGTSEEESWYRITRVAIGQRKLLTNEVDNVHVFLRKVARPE